MGLLTYFKNRKTRKARDSLDRKLDNVTISEQTKWTGRLDTALDLYERALNGETGLFKIEGLENYPNLTKAYIGPESDLDTPETDKEDLTDVAMAREHLVYTFNQATRSLSALGCPGVLASYWDKVFGDLPQLDLKPGVLHYGEVEGDFKLNVVNYGKVEGQ